MALLTVAAYAASPASSYHIVSIFGIDTGDINGDGSVNTGDVSELYRALLNGYTASKYDLNGDGQVNTGDVSELYGVILGSGTALQPTSITMNEYKLATSTQSAGNHIWQTSGEVIYITLDGVEENMYVLVMNDGEWELKDISGSTKAGFANSGTIKAMWVRNSNWLTAKMGDIPIPYDYATGSGTYRCKGSKVSIQLNLTLAESLVQVSSSEVSDFSYMTYATHVTTVFDINGLCDGETGEFVYDATSKPTMKTFGGGNWVVAMQNDVQDGKTVLHKTAADGRSYRAAQSYRLKAGEKASLAGAWTRDFTVRFYDADDTQTTQVLYPSTSRTIHMIVGTETTFYPQEGNVWASDADYLTRQVNNTNVAAFESPTTSHTVKALSVGETDMSITFFTKQRETYTFTAHIVVEPAIWIAGSYNGKPALYRNRELQYSSLSVSATAIDQVFVRKGTAYIRTYDSAAPNAAAYIMRSTNPVYHGSFTTRYNTKLTHFLVTQEGDIWYTNSNNIYKNNALVSSPTGVITDLIQDESSGTGYVWASGYISSSNATESSSSDVAWLLENVGGNYTRHVMESDRISTTIGGYQPDGRYYTGDRSPHFGRIAIQYNFVLINGFDIEEHAYRDYNGNVHPSYYNVDATYTYDATNRCLRQNNVAYYGHNFFFDNQTNERVYFLNNYGRLMYHNLRNNTVSEVNTGMPAFEVIRFVGGKLYAYTSGRVYVGLPERFFHGTYNIIYLRNVPYKVNDMFIETDCRN